MINVDPPQLTTLDLHPDHLITDNPALCQAAFNHESLKQLATIMRGLTPPMGLDAEVPQWGDEEEPEGISVLREVCSAVCYLSHYQQRFNP